MRPWLLWTILAVLGWGVWAIIGRLTGDSLTPAQSQAISTMGLLPIMLVLASSGKIKNGINRPRGMLLAAGSGVLTCVGNVAYYHVLNSGAKAVTVVPLTALYPLVTVALGLIFLKESLNFIQKSGILLSFIAIYLFNIQSTEGMISPWLLAALVPILFWGLSGFVQKLSTNHISGELSALCFLAAFVPIGIVLLMMEPLTGPVSNRVWVYSSLLGLTLGFGNFAILQAYARQGKASVIGPIGGLYPVVSIPLAMIFFREQIGWREALGMVLSCAAIAALAFEKPLKHDINN